MTTKTAPKIVSGQITEVKDLSVFVKPEGITRGRVFAPTDEEVASLAQSIKDNHSKDKHGQLAPCGVYPIDTEEGVQYTFAYGTTRYEAVKLLQEQGEDIGLRVELRQPTDIVDQFRMTSAENDKRVPVSPIDQVGMAIHLKKEEGLTQKEIAEVLGCTGGWVSQLMKLAKLSEDHQKLVHTKSLPVEAGVNLSKIKKADRQEVLDKALKDNGKYNGAVIAKIVEKKEEPEDVGGELAPSESVEDNSKSLRDLRDFLDDMQTPDDADPATKELANKIEKWLNGKQSDRQLTNAFDKHLEAQPAAE